MHSSIHSHLSYDCMTLGNTLNNTPTNCMHALHVNNPKYTNILKILYTVYYSLSFYFYFSPVGSGLIESTELSSVLSTAPSKFHFFSKFWIYHFYFLYACVLYWSHLSLYRSIGRSAAVDVAQNEIVELDSKCIHVYTIYCQI